MDFLVAAVVGAAVGCVHKNFDYLRKAARVCVRHPKEVFRKAEPFVTGRNIVIPGSLLVSAFTTHGQQRIVLTPSYPFFNSVKDILKAEAEETDPRRMTSVYIQRAHGLSSEILQQFAASLFGTYTNIHVIKTIPPYLLMDTDPEAPSIVLTHTPGSLTVAPNEIVIPIAASSELCALVEMYPDIFSVTSDLISYSRTKSGSLMDFLCSKEMSLHENIHQSIMGRRTHLRTYGFAHLGNAYCDSISPLQRLLVSATDMAVDCKDSRD